MVVNVTKIYQKLKNKSLLSIEKKNLKMAKKCSIVIIIIITIILRSNGLKISFEKAILKL